MNSASIKVLIVAVLVLLIEVSCSKSDFLDKKPNTSLVVPTTLEDFQKLLDNYVVVNKVGNLGEASSDDYYYRDFASWQSRVTHERNAYVWQPDLYEGNGNIQDWNGHYQQILYANIILEGLSKIQIVQNNEQQWKFIKGWALFVRAFALFNLAQEFAPVFDEATANTDLGLPIRLAGNVNVINQRSSVKATYDQILTDLTEARTLLPHVRLSPTRNRPYKAAAYALLARVYLSMRMYQEALTNAEGCLQLYDSLYTYPTPPAPLNPTDWADRIKGLPEVLYQCDLGFGGLFSSTTNTIAVDTTLYASYRSTDNRRGIFFKRPNTNPPAPVNYYNINLTYSGGIIAFGGLATNEIYLIKAECLARASNPTAAMNTLNKLLKKRIANYTDSVTNDPAAALSYILKERRKELVFRGLRWQDLRRLNKEAANIVLRRNLNGLLTLPPNSPLYVLPIPPDEIRLSGIQQNPR